MFHRLFRSHSSHICTFFQFPHIVGVGACAVEHLGSERRNKPAHGFRLAFRSRSIANVGQVPYLSGSGCSGGLRRSLNAWPPRVWVGTWHTMLWRVTAPLLVRGTLLHVGRMLRLIRMLHILTLWVWRVGRVGRASLRNRGIYRDVRVRSLMVGICSRISIWSSIW